MAVIETWIKTDLKKIVKVNAIGGNVFSQDNMANLIGVELLDNGQPASVSGSVSANVLRADGATVAVAGTLSGNLASVPLPQAAYAVPGMLRIVIKLTTGSTVTTIGAVQAIVYRSSTDTIVDPGTIIPSVQDLIAAIDAAVDSIPPDYSELTGEVSDLKNALTNEDYKIESELSKVFDTLASDKIIEVTITKNTGYMNPNGTVSAYNQYVYTQKIYVEPGDTIQLRNDDNHVIGTRMRTIAAYDLYGAIEAKGVSSNSTSYTVPSGIDFVIVTFDNDSYPNCTIIKTTKDKKLNESVLPVSQDEINGIINDSFELTPEAATLEIEVEKSNGYMLPGGQIGGTTGTIQYAHTQKIPVRSGDLIQLRNDDTGVPNTFMRYITAFDGDTAIEAKGSSSNTQSYTVPTGINFIVVTFDQDAYPNVTVTNLASLYTLKMNAENPDVKKSISAYGVPEIIVPDKSFAVVGHEWNMYYDNISNKLTDGYYLFCSGISGKSFDRLLRFTPAAGDVGTHTVTIGVYAKNSNELIDSKDFDLVVVADSAPTKRVMFIGDSLTEEGTYINEIQNVLSNGSITSVGTRTVTTTPGYSNIHHEGRSGWSAYDLTENANIGAVTNAFWNPSTSKFDFSYYAGTSYPAAVGSSFPGVDCVMLNLGTNGVNNVKRTCDAISEIITSIHAYNSSIKVIVSLITPPATQDGCGQHNGMFNANQWKIYELNLIKAYLELYQDVSTNVYVSEPYFNIDRDYDFPTRTVALSSRNPLQITIQDNNVHPNIYGYLKLADVYYANLLYRLQ